MAETAFHIDTSKSTNGLGVVETEAKLFIVNARDGTVVQSVSLKKNRSSDPEFLAC